MGRPRLCDVCHHVWLHGKSRVDMRPLHVISKHLLGTGLRRLPSGTPGQQN